MSHHLFSEEEHSFNNAPYQQPPSPLGPGPDQPLYPLDALDDGPGQQVVEDSDIEQEGPYGANQQASLSQREGGEEGEEELEENNGSEEGEHEMEEGEQEIEAEQGEEEGSEQAEEEGEAEQHEMS